MFISSELKEDKIPPRKSFIYLLQKGLGIDFNKNEFLIHDKLKFLENNNGEFLNSERNISCEIRILTYSDIPELNLEIFDVPSEKKQIESGSLIDHSKQEIISATKFSVFSQCPLKYKLIYQNGFNKLMEEQQKWNRET